MGHYELQINRISSLLEQVLAMSPEEFVKSGLCLGDIARPSTLEQACALKLNFLQDRVGILLHYLKLADIVTEE
jgi:hypothetical protein